MTVPEAFAVAWGRSNGDITEAIRAALDAHALSRRDLLAIRVTVDKTFAAAKNLAIRAGLLFGLTSKDMFGPSKTDRVCRVRFYAMWLVRRKLAISYPEIGHIFGGRDHSTVIAAVRRAEVMLLEDPEARQKLLTLVDEETVVEAPRVAA